MNTVRRRTLGLPTYKTFGGKVVDVSEQEIVVPTEYISRKCQHPNCTHEMFIWDEAFCHYCVGLIDSEYPAYE